jgi:hypothetical protein
MGRVSDLKAASAHELTEPGVAGGFNYELKVPEFYKRRPDRSAAGG